MITEPYIILSRNYFRGSLSDDGVIKEDNKVITDGDVKTVLTLNSGFIIQGTFSDVYGKQILRTFNKIILQNTDIQEFELSIRNPNTDIYIPVGVFTFTGSNGIIDLPELFETDAIRIEIINGSFLGELKVCKFLFNGDLLAKTQSSFSNDANAGDYRTVNGRLIHYKDFNKWKNDLTLNNLPKDQFDALFTQIKENSELVIMPYINFDIKAIYECYINPQIEYSVDRNTELYSLTLNCKEL